VDDHPLITIHCPSEIPYSSYFIAGIFELAAQGRCEAKLGKPLNKDLNWEADVLSTCLTIHWPGKSARVVLDLSDNSYKYATRFFPWGDLYFKRNLVRSDAPPELPQEKLLPTGLIYPVRSSTERGFARRWRWFAQQALRFRRSWSGRGYAILNAGLRYRELTRIPDFEGTPDDPIEDYVLYQTRLLEDDEGLDEERAVLIRALRRRFGSKFIGGFMPSPRALKKFPDCITTAPHERTKYLVLSRRARVNVYSRGLRDSPAWKLGEYLAAAACVVAEPPPTELPAPLESDRHWLTFSGIEQCLEQCERALKDAELVRRLRNEAHEYYRQHVHPAAAAGRVVSQASAVAR
jgi:hypothetical protein